MNRIFTAGYSGSIPETLAAVVEQYRAMLVDVRFSPRSRVPHWNGGRLKTLVGPRNYMHLHALGNAHYKSGGPIKLVDPDTAIDLLRPVLAKRPIILLCGCKDAATCHRTPAAEVVAAALGAEVEHLVLSEQPKVERNMTPKLEQLSLFQLSIE